MSITISEGTIYTPKDLIKLARGLAASKERMVNWSLRVSNSQTVLVADFQGKDGWTSQRTMVL